MKTLFKPLFTAAIFGLSFNSAANAQNASGDIWSLFQGAPTIEFDNGNTLKVRGRILWDYASLEEGSVSLDGSEFRTARLGVEGEISGVEYKAELDFSDSELEYKDVLISVDNIAGSDVTLSLGQMKTPNALNETTSSRHITFMERAAITDAFGIDRRIGAMLSKGGDNYSVEAGIFGTSIEAHIDDKESNIVSAARATFTPFIDGKNIVHVGASLRYTDEANSGSPKHSARWGSHQAKEKIKPNVGDSAMLYGFEAATVRGPLHAQAEYMSEEGDLGSASGYYFSAGWFLTGESRKYKASGGKFDRTKPNSPLSKGGMGAFEIAARYDTLDASGAGDEEMAATTFGLIWYPESHLRFKLEAVNADADTYAANSVQIRTQIDW